jgi:hypothetical protein
MNPYTGMQTALEHAEGDKYMQGHQILLWYSVSPRCGASCAGARRHRMCITAPTQRR